MNAAVSADGLTRGRLLLLAWVAAMGSMAMHMLVPALPGIARELRVDQAVAQLLVGVYLVGLGVGQLVAGPLSDMVGRRRVLLAGLALFSMASLAAALASNIELLLAARLAQAFGGAAGVVSGRTIVSDLSRGAEATGHLATLTTIVLVSPLIAPSIGGAIAGWADWRFIFAALAATGIVAGIIATMRLPVGRAGHVPVSFGALASVYARLARNTRFGRYVIAIAASSSALYIFLSGSSFLLIGQWGLDPEEAGLCYLGVTSAGLIGTLAVKRLEARGGAFRLGLTMGVVGGALMSGLALTGFSGPAYLLGPMLFVSGGLGVAAPAGIAGAMHAEAGMAGTASSLAGAVQMVVSAVVSGVVNAAGAGSFRTLAVSLVLASILALAAAPSGRSIIEEPEQA